jgi:glycosyltransferase involved in cell wall biosynthesis
MKKALLVTTISGFVPQFEMNSVALLQEHGYEVHYASNFNNVFYGKDNSRLDNTGIIRHQIDFARSPYSKQTLVAYRQLDKLLSEIEFDVIHCHTPMGSILARIVGNKHHVKNVIYTAHGFHFFKGAPIINWCVYYSAERMMAKYTDALITINDEDFQNAKAFKLKKGGKVYRIGGAGIDYSKYQKVDVNRSEIRSQLGVKENDFVLLSVGELNKNKNHETVIKGLHAIDHSDIKYLICGEGVYREELQKLIEEYSMEDTVKLLGYRTDIPVIEKIADMFVFPSHREGLPVSMMEAMASGLPVIASKVRGNVDIVEEGENGYLLSPTDSEAWGKMIRSLIADKEHLSEIAKNNVCKMTQYDKAEIKKQLDSIYLAQKIY